jgi:hypothetical protein
MNACQQLDRLTSRIRLMRNPQAGAGRRGDGGRGGGAGVAEGVLRGLLQHLRPQGGESVSLTWSSHSPSPCSLECSIGLASSALASPLATILDS